MGADKVLMPLAGTPLVERVWSRVAPIFARVILVGGEPRFDHRGIETVPDRYPGSDSLGGIATALDWTSKTLGAEAWVFCTACDMPFLEPALIGFLAKQIEGVDVVVPRTAAGFEPFCAFYRAGCGAVFEEAIRSGNLRIRDVFRQLRCREVGEEELRRFDPELKSFLNINRPEDLDAAARLLRVAG